MTSDIRNLWQGKVKVRISGAVPEKFVNLCLAQDILLWGLVRHGDELSCWLLLQDFYRIRPLARRSRCRVKVLTYRGWPFLVKRLLGRKMLLVGALLCLVTLQVLASYIWFVDVTGAKTVSPQRVLDVAREQGLRPGVPKDALAVKGLETSLLLAIPELSWASVTFTGTRAVVDVVEKTAPLPTDRSPSHIVAVKDGVITEIIVLAGQAVVKKGETVKKGDILIKGVIPERLATEPPAKGKQPPSTPAPLLIRANGIVKARVWYESYAETPLTHEVRTRTGRKTTEITLIVGGRPLVVKEGKADFAHYETEVIHKTLPEWRNTRFPVESNIVIYHENSVTYHRLTPEQARDDAAGRALAGVQQLIPENAEIISRHIATLKLDENQLVRVKVSVEAIEDMGQNVPVSRQ